MLISHSIREFCDLSVPIIMFDKNDDYIALRLEQVWLLNSSLDMKYRHRLIFVRLVITLVVWTRSTSSAGCTLYLSRCIAAVLTYALADLCQGSLFLWLYSCGLNFYILIEFSLWDSRASRICNQRLVTLNVEDMGSFDKRSNKHRYPIESARWSTIPPCATL